MSWKGRTVLVTGGDGFVGSSLVSRLEKEGAVVTTLSKKNGRVDRHYNVDVSKPIPLNYFRDCEVVFHLAGIADPKICERDPYRAFSVNTVGTLNILEACRKSNIEKVVFSSSAHIYGRPLYVPIDEKHPAMPISVYGYSKAAAEHICMSYGTTILRFFNIYGPNQKGNFLIPTIMSQLEKGEITLRNFSSKRDFVYIDDVVDALILAADLGNGLFNIGSGVSHSVKEIALTVCSVAKKQPKLREIGKNSGIQNLVADIKKAKKMLKWRPKTSLESGLKEVLSSMQSD
jgi:UDP-glucose 4-epimerase